MISNTRQITTFIRITILPWLLRRFYQKKKKLILKFKFLPQKQQEMALIFTIVVRQLLKMKLSLVIIDGFFYITFWRRNLWT